MSGIEISSVNQINGEQLNLDKRDAIMMRPTIAVSGTTEAKRREQGPMSEGNIIAAHPDCGGWLRELILSQLANADSGTT
jgi:hypothetical protein